MKWQLTSAVLGLGLLVGAGCSSSAADKRREFKQDEQERREERTQDLRELHEKEAKEEANPVVDVVRDWEKLGERTVDGFATDHDMIQIGHGKGGFSRLQLRVAGGNVVMQRFMVVFHDGEVYYPGVTLVFRDNSRFHEIDLPGKHRPINRVEFWYANEDDTEPARIELWGK